MIGLYRNQVCFSSNPKLNSFVFPVFSNFIKRWPLNLKWTTGWTLSQQSKVMNWSQTETQKLTTASLKFPVQVSSLQSLDKLKNMPDTICWATLCITSQNYVICKLSFWKTTLNIQHTYLRAPTSCSAQLWQDFRQDLKVNCKFGEIRINCEIECRRKTASKVISDAKSSIFYRTQVNLRSDLWVWMSVCPSLTHLCET